MPAETFASIAAKSIRRSMAKYSIKEASLVLEALLIERVQDHGRGAGPVGHVARSESAAGPDFSVGESLGRLLNGCRDLRRAKVGRIGHYP
jgi:hypothetical protein